MKHSVLALSILALTSLVQADVGEQFGKKCDAPEIKKLIGSTGSCRVVIASKKIEKRGSCSGIFMDQLACTVTFVVEKEGGAMNLTCGDASAPVINQDMEASGSGFNVATLIKKADGQDVVMNDKKDYSLISNQMVEVTIETLGTTSTGAISLNLESGPVPLTNVTCN